MKDAQVDLVPGRLVGHRQWMIVGVGTADNPFRLASLTAGIVWPWIPEVRAQCRRDAIGLSYSKFSRPVPHDPEDVPNVDCSCGIYASYRTPGTTDDRVIGVIEAWGPTVFGELAFRARYARLVALCWSSGFARFSSFLDQDFTEKSRTRLYQLGQLYRVPTFTDPGQMSDAFPASDVSALLPPPPTPEEIDIAAERAAMSWAMGNPAAQPFLSTSPAHCWCGSCPGVV